MYAIRSYYVEGDGGKAAEGFAAFGRRVSEGLLAAGFRPCPQRVMVDRPEWNRSLAAWKEYIDRLVLRAGENFVLRVSQLRITSYNVCYTKLLRLGRDVLSRMLFGARVSLWVGFVAVGLSVAIGLALGLLAGYAGGLTDEIVMRGVDVMLCFPSFFLILAVIAFLEPSLLNIMIVIGLTSWMGVARLVRAETLSLRSRDFVLAARVAGAGPLRILSLHILPNAIAPVLVSATLGVAGAILVESSLSFLGLGVQPPMPSWGNILMEGKDVLEIARNNFV